MVHGPAPTSAAPEVRAVVVDEVALVRLGITALLEPLGIDVVADTNSGRELANLVTSEQPRLVVLGRPGDMTVAETVWRMRRVRPRAVTVVLVAHDEARDTAHLVALGADGVALRTGRPEELARVVEIVLKGERAVAPALQHALVGSVRAPARDDADDGGLSRREREVLVLLAEGRSNREIADELSVTLATVKSHLVHVYAKLGAGSRSEALGRALALGLLS